ncbi:MAG: protein kinase [Deltaproteobacteria bacterium]|nr:protein kinase [Deltaproteobacteria bacterium]
MSGTHDPNLNELGTKPIHGAATASPTIPVYALPARLGRYTLTERIGVGGMAEVFVALQDGPAGFQKQVVVKRILPHLAQDPRFVEMFQREARLAASLHHTNIVEVFELDSDGDAHFIAMERIEGLTVHRLARRTWHAELSIPLEVVCGIAADAALGLQHAHERGLVHRDISPENLMINTEGVTKVLDFGIARSTASTSTLTKTGELKGKLPFMAPEQIRGDDVDSRADLYALGVTMYWLLTGQRPITAKSEVMLLHAALTEVPRRASELNPQVQPGVDALVLALLEKRPGDRPASGQEVYDALAHDLPARSVLSAPFVKEAMALPDAEPGSDLGTSESFIASSPRTPRIITGWRRALAADAEREAKRVAAEQAASAPRVSTSNAHRRALALAVGAAAALCLAVAGVAVRWGASTPGPDRAAQVDSGPIAPSPSPPLVAAPPTEVPGAAPPQPPNPVRPVAEPEATKVRAQARPKKVQLRGPAGVRWTSSKGKALGAGSTSAEVPGDATSVVALDVKRGVKTVVALDDDVADYAKAPRGKLDLRAFPFAEVFLGSEGLGLTPLPPISAVAGSYKIRFVYKGREEVRTVVLGRDRIERVVVDFR